jgi:hypothetical protein
VSLSASLLKPMPLLAAALLCVGGAVYAQLEGERGVPVIDSASSYEVSGIDVDVAAKDADAARLGGWRVAQRKGWRKLWSRVNSRPEAQAPGLSDSTLDSIISGVVIENEQIGPKRYVARLGLLFDRARAGQLLGVEGGGMRSPPMLVIPVVYSAATPMSLEQRNEWQRAWARFRPGGSPIDYIRAPGTGSDPLLLTAAQTRRPGRGWWRTVLDQYGAADIIVPEVYLTREWPGGPVTARFVARHGPDAKVLATFVLRVRDGDALPRLMDAGVERMDALYSQALRGGMLRIDPSLVIEEEPDELAAIFEEGSMADDAVDAGAASFTVQVDTPDAASLATVENSLKAVAGVRAAAPTSLALGGVSLFRLEYRGDLAGLRQALAARGWQVDELPGGMLRLRRGAPPPPAPAP